MPKCKKMGKIDSCFITAPIFYVNCPLNFLKFTFQITSTYIGSAIYLHIKFYEIIK